MKRIIFSSLMFFSALNCSVSAHEKGDKIVRLRYSHRAPDDASDPYSAVAGSWAAVDNGSALEIDLTRMLTKKWAVEGSISMNSPHVRGKGSLAGTDFAKPTLVLTTLLFQYHPFPESRIGPYLGIGGNYANFWHNKDLFPGSKTNLSDNLGLAGQGGIDVMLTEKVMFNFDIKYLAIDTLMNVNGASNGKAQIDVNPWVFGAGLGLKF